jgi:hypothetical protein
MLKQEIFTANEINFEALSLKVFQYQFEQNLVYRQYCQTLKIDIQSIDAISKIPFLPISFFKSHSIISTQFTPAAIFESSGTSKTINSKHLVKDLALYQESFSTAFNQFYGNPKDWCILALLPSYLERNNSSLVVMADQLIKESNHSKSGFYLHNMEELKDTLLTLEQQQQKTLLIGVTFALLDFAEQYPMPLNHTTIMETGGMKGRIAEMTREQVHGILKAAFKLPAIHSEYGMTELLSQAYSYGNGIFNTPPWMKVLLREEDDPFAIHTPGSTINAGAVNIIDLANLYSCSFIATEDAGKLYPDGSFEIIGRLENTAIRGCSLMAV